MGIEDAEKNGLTLHKMFPIGRTSKQLNNIHIQKD